MTGLAMDMEFCLLGPLAVRSGGATVPVAAGKQRAVLAALLLAAGRVVPADELAGVLWGAAPPASARVSVQNYVARLRQALGEPGRARIETRPGGYLIRVAADELDVTRFEALARAAQAAARAGSWDAAAARGRAALALWRGEPLADAGSEVLVRQEAPRLAELRLQALEARIEADVRRGHPAEVVAELRGLVSDHPLRDHLRALLMLALYRDGRPGEALAAYQQARRVLAGELGTEPGPALQELHQRMLAADPALAAPEPWPPEPWPLEAGSLGAAPLEPGPAECEPPEPGLLEAGSLEAGLLEAGLLEAGLLEAG
ncbi:MAG TPA: AfsR/SARP family transcriptional regulator, partial [Streptosporangiaceae bacterium]|nr:AfsR/SARP family transcriptional regulator [Streptosporangiaceae bacterium]